VRNLGLSPVNVTGIAIALYFFIAMSQVIIVGDVNYPLSRQFYLRGLVLHRHHRLPLR